MITNLFATLDLWETLALAKKPIVLYGMGDGGDKILNVCQRLSIPVAAVFASDGFVRGQSFRGYPVRTLAQVEQELGSCIVLLAFATSLPQVLADIDQVARRHTLYAPDLPVCGNTLFTGAYARSRLEDAQAVYRLLADEASRQVYLDILRYKLSGQLNYLHRCASPKDRLWEELIKPGDSEIFVDAGAYRGDTVEEFLKACGGRYRSILALEPDRRNFAKLQGYVDSLGLSNIDCRNIGVWSGPCALPFAHKSGRQAALGQMGTPTPVDSIDNLLQGGEATILKYDVEGAEAQALLGSSRTMENYAPRLIVSAYHRGEDLFDLPLLLHKLQPAYKLYLRRHPCVPAWDINLVAVR